MDESRISGLLKSNNFSKYPDQRKTFALHESLFVELIGWDLIKLNLFYFLEHNVCYAHLISFLRFPKALEAQEQEKERLRQPPQIPSPVPGGRRSCSPQSDRTPTPDPQCSPSPGVSTTDLNTNNDTSRSTPLPPAAELHQDTPSFNGEPEDGGSEQVTASRG